MPDITELILSDHEWFRRQFAALDALRASTSPDEDELRQVWDPLAARLDVHAIAEEEIFYPELLRVGKDPEDETLDAIGDHNDIRDGVHDAVRHPLGTDEWWGAVGRARVANDEHMGEEEHEGLSNFRVNAPDHLRESLGARFTEFMGSHRTTSGLDTSDKDPDAYVRGVEKEIAASDDGPASGPAGTGSLGIGSLKGR